MYKNMQFYSLNLSKFRTISRNQRKSAKSSSCHDFPQIVALPRFQDYVTLEDRKGGAKIKNEGGSWNKNGYSIFIRRCHGLVVLINTGGGCYNFSLIRCSFMLIASFNEAVKKMIRLFSLEALLSVQPLPKVNTQNFLTFDFFIFFFLLY